MQNQKKKTKSRKIFELNIAEKIDHSSHIFKNMFFKIKNRNIDGQGHSKLTTDKRIKNLK